jgi:hypothetical protein
VTDQYAILTESKHTGGDQRKEWIIQGDQKVSVHLMITIQKSDLHSDCFAADRQGRGGTRLTLTPSVIPKSNYVVMVSD